MRLFWAWILAVAVVLAYFAYTMTQISGLRTESRISMSRPAEKDVGRQETALEIDRIDRIQGAVQRQIYTFLIVSLIVISVTACYFIYSNRRLAAQLAEASELRSELAQKLISTHDSTMRYISRELHDEFGQILTAIGILLNRSWNRSFEGAQLRASLREVAEITQTALDNARSLSQALHPVMIDEHDLESALESYAAAAGKQTGIEISYEKLGTPRPVDGAVGIHIYRTLQAALNNVARHSGAKNAWVRLRFMPDALELEVEDHGVGFSPASARHGIGLVAMRERAELLHGHVEFLKPAEGGTLVRFRVPFDRVESDDAQNIRPAG